MFFYIQCITGQLLDLLICQHRNGSQILRHFLFNDADVEAQGFVPPSQ